MAAPFALKDIPKTRVIIVAGPTASGKSDWALAQALRDYPPDRAVEKIQSDLSIFGSSACDSYGGPSSPIAPLNPDTMAPGRLINGDSMQLYRGLDILTAMPSLLDQGAIPHDLYGILPSHSGSYDVSQWMAKVHQCIARAQHQNQRAWVVGGTGFYLKTLMDGLSPMPFLNPDDKASLRYEYRHCTILELKQWLEPVDPVSAHNGLDYQRLLHAWIVYRLTGHALSWWHQKPRVPSPWSFYKVLLWPSRETILARAAHRWESMVAQGVYDQVQSFCSHPAWEKSALRKAIGLAPIHAMLEGRISPEQCREQYAISLAQYVKRQRTWFRGQFQPDYICDEHHRPIDRM